MVVNNGVIQWHRNELEGVRDNPRSGLKEASRNEQKAFKTNKQEKSNSCLRSILLFLHIFTEYVLLPW
jgi:hypothetical protein